jgi:hypothetical protein
VKAVQRNGRCAKKVDGIGNDDGKMQTEQTYSQKGRRQGDAKEMQTRRTRNLRCTMRCVCGTCAVARKAIGCLWER